MTTDTVGGVWHYALELCRGLEPHGVRVMLATMGPPPSAAQRAEAAALPNVTLRTSTFRLEWMNDPWTDVARAGDWLLELAWTFTPDVVHLNGYSHAALAWPAPTVVVAHSCVLSWWRAVRGTDAPADWTRYREAVTAGLRSAGLLIAPTHAMLEAIDRHYGSPAAQTVIPNGRSVDAFCRSTVKEPFILSVGRLWDEAKNTAALAAVAPRLAWPVRVAGDCAAPDGAAAEFPNVETLGHCPPAALAHHFAAAAIYALPARYEPFGLSVLEAALAGCALVLGDIPSLRENWDGAAEFVAPGDHAALRETLERLIADPARRHRLAACARQRAARFSVERMVARYLDAYRTAQRTSTAAALSA